METDSGHTVLKDEFSGKWFYAVVNAQGNLDKSPFLVGKVRPRELGIREHLRPRSLPGNEKRLPRISTKTSPGSPSSLTKTLEGLLAAKDDQPAGSTTVKNLVILARFPDHTTYFTRDDFDALFNEIGYSTDGAYGSVRDYYLETSHGKVAIENTVTDWVVLPNEEAYYGANDAYGRDLRQRQMARDAIEALDDTGFDFSPFDGDGDGFVDLLTVVHSGLGEECTANPDDCIWSHMASWWPYVRVDGIAISQYCSVPERRYNTRSITRVGTICHEMGHLFGLPDLYDSDLSSSGIAAWGTMAVGSWGGDGVSPERPVHFCCWSKMQLGWLTPTELTASSSLIAVPQIEETTSPVAYRISYGMGSGEYFLIANRQKRSYDAKLPSGGLLIWHVDENRPDNDNEDHYMVGLLQADGRQDLEESFDWADAGDPFPGSTENRSLTPDTNPSTDSYYEGNTDIWVTSISDATDEMTFNLSLGGPPPLNEPPKISLNGVSQRRDGSGHLELTFTGTDPEGDLVSWVVSNCRFAAEPYTEWQSLSFDLADPAHTAHEPMPFTETGETFVAVIDAFDWNGSYRIRLQVGDGTSLSLPVVSSSFAVDNVPADLSLATHIEEAIVTSGATAVTGASSWEDLNPGVTWFSLKLSEGTWSAPVSGSPVGTSSQSVAFNSLSLNGDDYLTVKSYHVDAFGNRSIESISSAYYVVPVIPQAPRVSTVTPSSLVVTVVPAPNETGDVDYAVRCSTVNKYVDCSTGSFVDEPLWGTFDEWNGEEGVRVIGLYSKTTYSFTAVSANPWNHDATSEHSAAASATTVNSPPNPPLRVELSPEAPFTTDEILCTVTSAYQPDPDTGDTVRYVYVWRNGVNTVLSGPKASLSDTLSYVNTAKGELWTCGVVATDGEASSEEVCSSVLILNYPPTLEVSGALTVYQSSSVNLSVTAMDADDDHVRLSCEGAHEGATFFDAGDGTGSFQWTPTSAGTYDGITFVADDGEEKSFYPVSVTVAPTCFEISYIGVEPVLGDRKALAIMWFGIPGATYSVFRSDDVATWECVGSGISLPAESERGEWLSYREEMSESAEVSFFYRVAME